jgi:hypothetical protein
MNGNVDAAVDSFGFLPAVYSIGGKVIVQVRQVLLTSKLLILYPFFVAFTQSLVYHGNLVGSGIIF